MNASHYFTEIVGIIGGVGPEATNYFVSLLTKLNSRAKKDQDHIPYLLLSNPQTPDRTEFLLNGKASPLPELVHTASVLKHAGATFVVIPCNTAHALVNKIHEAVGIDVLNMINLTTQQVIRQYGSAATVGLLATTGTRQTLLYQHAFAELSKDITVLIPDESNQQKVMEGIYSIKENSVTPQNFSLLYDVAVDLIDRGADVVILGCTEIPLVLTKRVCLFPIIDPMEVLAEAVIERTLSSAIILPQKRSFLLRHKYL